MSTYKCSGCGLNVADTMKRCPECNTRNAGFFPELPFYYYLGCAILLASPVLAYNGVEINAKDEEALMGYILKGIGSLFFWVGIWCIINGLKDRKREAYENWLGNNHREDTPEARMLFLADWKAHRSLGKF